LKLALCGCVKDSIIPAITMADYLLYHINRIKPREYGRFSPPTNDIATLLESISRKSGRLAKGGVPDLESSAHYMISLWRSGKLGTFVLDDVNALTLQRQKERLEKLGGSINQARKARKESRKDASLHDANTWHINTT